LSAAEHNAQARRVGPGPAQPGVTWCPRAVKGEQKPGEKAPPAIPVPDIHRQPLQVLPKRRSQAGSKCRLLAVAREVDKEGAKGRPWDVLLHA
jgi:hypothetical protein